MTGDSGRGRKSVTFNRNQRSRSVGTTGHVQVESAVNLVRNTHLKQLNAEDLAELEKAQFVIQCQDTFRAGTEAILGAQHMLSDAPVVRTVPDGPVCVRFSHSKVVAEHDNTAAKRARNAFVAASANVVIPVTGEPGTILLINNRRALHGRSPVGEGHGGNTRWLLRSYALDPSVISAESRYRDTPYQLFP